MREKAEEARSAIDLSLSIFCLTEQLLPQSGFKTLGSTNVVKTVSNSLVHTFRQKRRLFRYFHTRTKYLRSFHKIFDIFIISEQKNLVQRNNLELCRKLCFCCPDKLVGRLWIHYESLPFCWSPSLSLSVTHTFSQTHARIHTHTHTRSHSHTHTHTHTHTRTHTRTNTHARTHTHTHTHTRASYSKMIKGVSMILTWEL